MHDPFVGTWKLNPGRSEFDQNHRPADGTMRWHRDAEGAYRMHGEGINEKGERVTERPQTLIPDGRPRPVPDFPGLFEVTTRPEPNALHVLVRREDGSVVGEGRYVVTAGGQSLTATTVGIDTQLRRFETRTVWDRQ